MNETVNADRSAGDIYSESPAPEYTDRTVSPDSVNPRRSAYDTLRDPEFWLFRIFPLRFVLSGVLVAAAVAWIVLAFGASAWYALGAGVVVGLVGLAPIGGRTLIARIGGAAARRRQLPADQLEQAAAFDVPLPEGGGYGVCWDGDLLLTMLRIDPPPDTLTLLQPGSLSTEQLLPLPEIARCLDQFDLTLAGIDVVSTGARTAGTGVAAHLYDRIIGPLPAIAHRTCWLVLRLDPLANAEAVDNRGGGGAGALRAAIIATRRVANRLAAHDIAASVLSAAEMNAVVRELTHGFAVDMITESPKWLESQGRYLAQYQIGADMVGPRGLADIWTVPSLSTTVTLRLRPGIGRNDPHTELAETVVLNAVVRFDTVAPPERPPLDGLRELYGNQLRILLDTLPVGRTGRWGRDVAYRGTLAALSEFTVPTAGCGQLIGADDLGQGIAVPLIGEGTRQLEVIGTLDLAQQVILRATALGAHAIVHTARPDAWQTMVRNLDTPQLLTIAPRAAGASYHPPGPPPLPTAPYPSTTLLVFDGVPAISHAGGATIVHVRQPHEPPGSVDADVSLIQDPATPNRITVRTPAVTTTVNMVTTREEMHYIGESLAAR
ncbi:type VII secretion protein EccE [Nocardia carnea]|uniref:type VII secretion protein EccE n=1 Tax=Nocardia carnea TaxID=37328 RepID=UPI002456F16B|nr:type VII secretion protein EccE [Nocardia carnea]